MDVVEAELRAIGDARVRIFDAYLQKLVPIRLLGLRVCAGKIAPICKRAVDWHKYEDQFFCSDQMGRHQTMEVGWTNATYGCMHCWEESEHLSGPDIRANLGDLSKARQRTKEEVNEMGRRLEWLKLQSTCNADAKSRRAAEKEKRKLKQASGVRGLGSFC